METRIRALKHTKIQIPSLQGSCGPDHIPLESMFFSLFPSQNTHNYSSSQVRATETGCYTTKELMRMTTYEIPGKQNKSKPDDERQHQYLLSVIGMAKVNRANACRPSWFRIKLRPKACPRPIPFVYKVCRTDFCQLSR